MTKNAVQKPVQTESLVDTSRIAFPFSCNAIIVVINMQPNNGL